MHEIKHPFSIRSDYRIPYAFFGSCEWLRGIFPLELLIHPEVTATIRDENECFAIRRPSTWKISTFIQSKMLGADNASTTGVEVGHVDRKMARPPQESKLLAVGCRALTAHAKTRPTREAAGLSDGLTRVSVEPHLPEVATRPPQRLRLCHRVDQPPW